MSQAIDLDFIDAPLFSLARFAWLRSAALAIGLVVISITWQAYQAKSAELVLLQSKQQTNKQSQLNQLSQLKQIQPNGKQSASAIAPEKIKELQETVDALAMPWNALFEAIEQARGKDVALLSLEPNAKKQQVQIMGEAKNLQAALQYVARLQLQSALSQVFLQKHSIDESNMAKPVSFTVLAKWQIVR